MPRPLTLHVMVSETERAAWRAAAEECGLTVSAWLRMVAAEAAELTAYARLAKRRKAEQEARNGR